MNQRIIIVGKGGSGKDFLQKKFMERGFNKSISFTTRPPRENEVDKVDYFFVSEEVFSFMEQNGNYFYETACFNGWWYGSSFYDWKSLINAVYIKTPSGVAKITPEDRKSCFIIYLDIDKEIRRERLLQRQDADSVERRLIADHEDFKEFIDFDIRITNPNF